MDTHFANMRSLIQVCKFKKKIVIDIQRHFSSERNHSFALRIMWAHPDILMKRFELVCMTFTTLICGKVNFPFFVSGEFLKILCCVDAWLVKHVNSY